MIGIMRSVAAAAALAISAPVAAQEPGARAPVFVSFDGVNQLGREASRQGLLKEKIGFTLEVGPDGKPIECRILRDFRRKATELALCRPLLRYMTFEPATDAGGNPTTGRYTGEIDFQMWMSQDGYLVDR